MKNTNNVQIVGDDLYVTNLERLKKGFLNNSSNSILIKLNQIGTVSETLEVIKLLLLTIVFVKKNSLLLTSLDLIQSGFFLIGFKGLLTFSGCLGLVVILFNYIKGLSFFAKHKFFSN